MITTFIPWVMLLGIFVCGIGAVIYLKRTICFLISKQFRLALRPFLASCAFGLVPGLVIMAILDSPLHSPAKRSICTNNLKSFVLFMKMYAGDHNDKYPVTFNDMVGEYINSSGLGVFICKGSGHQVGSSTNIHSWTDYAYVSGLSDTDSVDCVLAFCLPENHKDEGTNVGFIGGQVRWFSCKPYKDSDGKYQPTFQELTNTPSLFYGTTNEVELADLMKRTRIIYPHHSK